MESSKSKFPINLDHLIHRRVIENERVEFKTNYDEFVKPSIVRTISAFANDLMNNNGGYIILGIEEKEGKPILPPRGLDDLNVDNVQKEIIGECKRGISPEYLPHIYILSYQERTIMVIWASAGDNRPYEAPLRKGKGKTYWIRSSGATVEAIGDLRRQLMEHAAKIPFDDRRNMTARVEDISPVLVKRFLADIRSHLASANFTPEELYENLKLVVPVNAHKEPRNVALLFFNEDPERFFEGTHIEVVQFGDDASGDLIEEKIFRGPVHEQIRNCVKYLDGLGGSLSKKVPGQAEVDRTVPYPYEAMEEAIVNAVYHRSYEYPPEPIKVYLYPDRMEITSYPGPVPGIKIEHLQSGRMPSFPTRNRRIGDFLKDLRLAEGKGTGIPKIHRKMNENGSPEASFDFDDGRTYFQITLPVHPRYQLATAIREASHLWVIGSKNEAVAHLSRAVDSQPGSGILVNQLIEYAKDLDNIELARKAMNQFEKQEAGTDRALPYLTMTKLLLEQGFVKEAVEYLKRMPPLSSVDDTLETAILKKRAGDLKGAHALFKKAYPSAPDNPKLLHEFAQTKIRLAKATWGKRNHQTRKKLNKEAVELLRKALQLTLDTPRQAWCWYNLAEALEYLRFPKNEVEEAYKQAMTLMPGVAQFTKTYKRWKDKAGRPDRK